MDFILGPLLSWLLLYKYAALFLIVYSAALILPLPASATIMAAGAFSSQGYFSFWELFAAALMANFLGDFTGYCLTRRYGESIVRALRLDRASFFENLKEELRADAAATIFLTRFAGSLDPIASLLAGLVGVPVATFSVFSAAGNALEISAILSAGFVLGSYWNGFSLSLDLLTGIVALAVVMFVLLRIRRRILRRISGRNA